LIVKKLPKGLDGNDIAKKIGGNSSYDNHKLKLAFYSPGGKEPVAVIKIKPMGNIMTTTKIEYSHEDSIVDNNEIKKVEWMNNKEYFDEEGVHTVKLRVMDKHFRWSEWESVDIFVSEAKGIKKLAAGGNHLFVIHRNGTIDAYGDNEFGQLGNCTNQENQKMEEVVQIKHVDDIAVGDFHTLFLKSDRKVFATGNNESGQLGIGSKNNSKIPKLCWGIENIIQVSCGNGFSAAVTSDGFVYTWGQNEAMCLGHGKNHFVVRPVRVDGVENVKEISLGSNYILALSYDGVVKARGMNDHGELGLGFKSKSSEPLVTNFKDIKSVCAGKGFSYGITSGNRVLAVGNN
ncbi:hypothetical protein, partial [Sphaerochaeta sp. S2]|uniref:RCC1 domain-containing protein n=1 Tax=Sphaerochaeta sp. S2 TaxID=2798868 RepID=UPI0018E9E2FE